MCCFRNIHCKYMEFNKHWIAYHAVCLCLFLLVVLVAVLPPSRHLGLLCCLGMLQSLRERSTNVQLPHWHRAEEAGAISRPTAKKYVIYIQTLHLHFFTKRKPHHWESLMFCLIQKNRERLEKHWELRLRVQGEGLSEGIQAPLNPPLVCWKIE